MLNAFFNGMGFPYVQVLLFEPFSGDVCNRNKRWQYGIGISIYQSVSCYYYLWSITTGKKYKVVLVITFTFD